MKAIIALLAGLALAGPVAAQMLAITGGTVVVGDGSEPVPGGTVVIRDGRVVAAGANIDVPAGAQIVDATGQWVTPGIVGGFTRLGLVEVGAVSSTNDISAAESEFSAGLDVAPAINPLSAAIATNRTGGVTRAVVAPGTGNAIFGGQGAIIDLGADMNAIMRSRAFQFVELGERGAQRAGGSRTASFATFRNALDQAQRYARNPEGYGGQSSDALNRVDAAALVAVVQGRVPLIVHVEQARDILNVIAIRDDYPRLDLILVGVSEGWTVAEEIATADVPVIASALNDLPAQFEQLAATQSNIGRMRAAGVQVAIGMIDDRDAHQIRYSAQYAGNLVALGRIAGATGLGWGEAFAAISAWPAEIMGLGNEIGSLRPGRRADVVIWDGDPLELGSNVNMMLIDGVQQPLTSRQTRLRDRYLSIDEQQLPQAYEW